MKAGWERKAFRDVLEIRNGRNQREVEADSGQYPIMGSAGKPMGYATDYICEAGATIIGRKGTINTPIYIETRFWNVDTAFGLSPRSCLDSKFLYYFCLSYDFAALNRGTTIPSLVKTDLQCVELPLPPLDEQRLIVAVLDKAFAGIATATANAQKNLTSTSSLFASALAEALQDSSEEWEMCELQSLLIKGRKISYGIVKPGDHDPEGVRLVKSQQVRDDAMDLTADFRITKALDKEYARTRLQGGEILLNLVGASIGRSAVAPKELRGANVSRAIAVIPVIDDLVRWVQYNLRGRAGQELIRSATGGSAQPVLNLAEVKNLTIPVPPLEKRRDIMHRLDTLSLNVQTMSANYRRKVLALTELKQSLLQKAFAGELTTAIAEPVAPVANDNFATAQFTAQVIAFAHRRHERQQSQKTFGHVKAQKVLHLVEIAGGIDLGRQPIKDAAGPNDFQHMLRATDWAVQQGFFEFVPRTGGKGYDFKKLANYDALLADALAATKPVGAALEKVIDLIVPMVSLDVELFVTVHAAWNNLIRDGVAITDDAIVKAARDDWHSAKLKIPEHKFRDSIRTIKAKGMEPDGTAKYVGGQVKLI